MLPKVGNVWIIYAHAIENNPYQFSGKKLSHLETYSIQAHLIKLSAEEKENLLLSANSCVIFQNG